MSGAELSVLVLCLLDQNQSVIRQSALLKSHYVRSCVTGPPRQPLSASEFSERIVHKTTNPISGSVELSLLLLLLLLLLLPSPALRHFWTLLAPLWLSLSFDGCICHFGFLVQTLFSKWWRWFNWRWQMRRRQRRTAAAATPFPAVT